MARKSIRAASPHPACAEQLGAPLVNNHPARMRQLQLELDPVIRDSILPSQCEMPCFGRVFIPPNAYVGHAQVPSISSSWQKFRRDRVSVASNLKVVPRWDVARNEERPNETGHVFVRNRVVSLHEPSR
ncbi:uncharacterized protein GLRG_11362 [Colletotrichum graminicola M1.001]|uniref:Uncharacterized protein n=1 Tax=Colletotrichum graminicola (strain M1.001 / M2 / FGSC 10212) TaxID=645133 RepID=E3QZC9_COLGM|nr:uncharacterized protein GLRG_11362 [Colletotrichum graminicola M1.001]EFQ36217.1 hypothetical protein GLRG_11362 [Colletotrichum graminicola M1.001]